MVNIESAIWFVSADAPAIGVSLDINEMIE
jgi:hypothetical protein